jgi:hypothetical protein
MVESRAAATTLERELAAVGQEATRLALELATHQDVQGWRGPDPYDGLLSPVAGLLAGRRSRQALVQAVRRSPVNLRPLLGIGPLRMAAATGLAASAAARMTGVDPWWGALRDRLGSLTAAQQIPGGPARGLWGYEFDVQTRWGFYGSGSANAIATVVAARGCLDAGSLTGTRQAALGEALLGCFWRGTYFAYTLDSTVLIHNANLLVASLAARLACGRELEPGLRAALRRAAGSAVETAVAAQRPDGSWPYGEGPSLGWVDGFHTAYSLLALDETLAVVDGPAGRAALDRGARFYFTALFDGPVPRLFAGPRAGPSDINNVATGLRAAVWGAERGHVAPTVPGRVLEVLRDGFWDARRQQVRASTARHRPAARLDFPRWGAAPALDALTALAAWEQGRGSA